MLFGEWKLEDALVVEREEGIEEGLERGREKRETEIARNVLGKGASVEFIQKNTGLSTEAIQSLASR
jgi:predicted transposase YdaD